MPDVNLLKNTEKYDPNLPKPPAPAGPGPLSDPVVESTGLLGAIRNFFSRRGKVKTETITPVLGQSVGGGGRMNLEKAGRSDRILAERKSKPTMIKLPEEEEGGFSINLLGQDVGRAITLREQVIRLAMVAGGSILVVGFVYAGLVVYAGTISTDIQTTKEKIDALQTSIKKLEGEQTEIVATTKKIGAISSLIDRHVYWSKFFRKLEATTGPDVFYGTSFTGDLNGSIILSARTSSFDAVATQYLFFVQSVLKGDFIRTFTITGVNREETQTGSEVSFAVTLELIPEVFYKTLEEVEAEQSGGTQPTDGTTAPATDLNTNTSGASGSEAVPTTPDTNQNSNTALTQ